MIWAKLSLHREDNQKAQMIYMNQEVAWPISYIKPPLKHLYFFSPSEPRNIMLCNPIYVNIPQSEKSAFFEEDFLLQIIYNEIWRWHQGGSDHKHQGAIIHIEKNIDTSTKESSRPLWIIPPSLICSLNQGGILILTRKHVPVAQTIFKCYDRDIFYKYL